MENFKEVQISRIKENPSNPRYIQDGKYKKLKKSIQDFPDMLTKRPMVVDENMVVLGGNMRLKALTELGYKTVPVIIAEGWSEEQKREFIIKDNVGFGNWDYDMLANEWNMDELSDWGMDIPTPGEDDEPAGYTPPDDPFNDDGQNYSEQYGVILICSDDKEQEEVFEKMKAEGYNCKIVVT